MFAINTEVLNFLASLYTSYFSVQKGCKENWRNCLGNFIVVTGMSPEIWSFPNSWNSCTFWEIPQFWWELWILLIKIENSFLSIVIVLSSTPSTTPNDSLVFLFGSALFALFSECGGSFIRVRRNLANGVLFRNHNSEEPKGISAVRTLGQICPRKVRNGLSTCTYLPETQHT